MSDSDNMSTFDPARAGVSDDESRADAAWESDECLSLPDMQQRTPEQAAKYKAHRARMKEIAPQYEKDYPDAPDPAARELGIKLYQGDDNDEVERR